MKRLKSLLQLSDFSEAQVSDFFSILENVMQDDFIRLEILDELVKHETVVKPYRAFELFIRYYKSCGFTPTQLKLLDRDKKELVLQNFKDKPEPEKGGAA